MSEENLEAEREVTLRAYEAWNARDFDACIALVDPEVEWTFSGGAQMPGTDEVYRGHEGVRRFWSEFIDPWESLRIEITDTREAGDTLVVFVKFHGVGMGSGVELTMPFVHLMTYRNRKLRFARKAVPRQEILRGRCRRRTSKILFACQSGSSLSIYRASIAARSSRRSAHGALR